jgi:hypothetical protein
VATLLELIHEVRVLLEHLPDKHALHNKEGLEPIVEDILDQVEGKFDVSISRLPSTP